MGNVYEQRFKEIWFGDTYNTFRRNGVHMSKCNPYFSRIGNEASKRTGCYNCDNLWQNVPLHNKLNQLKEGKPEFYKSTKQVLKKFF